MALKGEGLITVVIKKLNEILLSTKISSLKRFNLLKELSSKLTVASVLHSDAEYRQLEEEAVRKWLDDFKDVIYRTQDLVDDIDYDHLSKNSRKNKIMSKIVSYFSKSTKSHAKELLKDITSLLESELGRDLKVAHNIGNGVSSTKIRVTPWLEKSQVHGRDDDKDRIIELLLSNDIWGNQIGVLPIVGMGGLGKTTIAQLIYDDIRLEEHGFQHKVWVTVSTDFDVSRILQIIFQQINPGGKSESGDLILHLREFFKDKRFLIVLDDVWDGDDDYDENGKWHIIKSIFECGDCASRIIVTTRSRKVASNLITGPIYELQGLSNEHSWKIFVEQAFGGELNADQRLEEIGKKLVENCGGVPLAIQSLGGLLRSENDPKQWEHILNSHVWKTNKILPSLWLSYRYLPSSLKQCFTYCSIFPKDYEIEVETIITLWMSQGFIEQGLQEEQDVETAGYICFMDLLQRSFFQGTKKDELGNITKFKLQNLMHDLGREVAGNKGYATLRLKENKIDRVLRHVSFDFHLDSSWQIPIPSSELKRIRSLILPRQFRWAVEGKSSKSICDGIIKFKLLRMLDLHNSGIKVLPNSIGELKHLCYLDLSLNVSIMALPNSISELHHLQTLKLNHCSNLQSLPRGITMLFSLRNLENESCYSLTQMPRGLHRLSELRRLSEFVLSTEVTGSGSKQNGKLDELSDLNYLRGKLKIKNLTSSEDGKTAKAKLYEKHHLLSLILIWDIEASVHHATDCEETLEDLRPHPNLRELSLSGYGGSKFSSWLPSLENLVKLSLSRCNRCHCLPPLHHLPNLEILVVDELMKLEYILDKRASFQSLKELRLTNLPELERWWKGALLENVEEEEEMSTFPSLSKLVVEDCPNLTSMPLFPYLEDLLVLKNTSWEPLQRTVAAKEVKMFPTTSSSTSFTASPLFKLRALQIIDMSNGDPQMWQSLRSLRSVTLDHLVDINDHLQGLRQVTTLQQLHIWRCNNLKEIPSWIRDFKSLKTISIKLCPQLTIQPYRNSLKLDIEDCPQVSNMESMLKNWSYT